MTEDTNFLDTQQAARFLGLSAKTLARYRVTGDGPVFHRFGNRIRYRRAALDAWADARERVSTVDDGGDRPGAGSMRAPARKMPGSCSDSARGTVALAGLTITAVLTGPEIALATTDTTFGNPLDTVQDIVGGTGGQLAAALAVGAALVGSVLRFNAMQLMGAVEVGIAAGAGTGIVTGLVGTAIV